MAFPHSNPFRRSLLACAVAAGLALTAGTTAAQNAGDKRSNDRPSTTASADTKRAEKDARKSWEQTHRASKIIGTEVRSAQDQKVGRVKDLVLADPSSGTISHVVVSVGGVAGLGDKLFAVPFNQLQSMPGKDYFVLSANSDLSKGFDDNNWPADTAWQDGSASRMATPSATPPMASTPSTPPSTPSTPPSAPSTASSTPPAPAPASSSADTSSATTPSTAGSATPSADAPTAAQTPGGTPQ